MNNPHSIPANVLLPPLLTSVLGMNDEQIEGVGRRLYQDYCVAPARAGHVLTHDGAEVFIYGDDFDHAFFEAATKHRRGYAKDVIDARRVARTRWIPPILAGHVAGTKCYRIVDYGSFRKPPPEKRLYVVREEIYVIWLLPRRNGGWKLKTAYCTGHGDIDRYIYRQRLIWERG